MLASRQDMPASVESDAFRLQEAEWGGLHAAFESFAEKLDVGPLLADLPENEEPLAVDRLLARLGQEGALAPPVPRSRRQEEGQRCPQIRLNSLPLHWTSR